MLHEFNELIDVYNKNNSIGLKSVLATVVALDGSSYRRPGVRMLIDENGNSTGAVSGGCVEKEIIKQSFTVFKTNVSKVISYDGRYRLGCDGILYILIEPFNPSQELLSHLKLTIENRNSFKIVSIYEKEYSENNLFGSYIAFKNESKFYLNKNNALRDIENTEFKRFSQIVKPAFQLLIFGEEHDAVQLSKFAAHLGWEVTIVSSPSSPQTILNFPGAKKIIKEFPGEFPLDTISNQTSIVLMSHSYVKDLKHLLTLKGTNPLYIGILGPVSRREQLLNEFIEKEPLIEESFLNLIHAPAGLNLGAETPQEIALSICSEILSVQRNKESISLKNISGPIHNDITF